MTKVECSITIKQNGICFLGPTKVNLLREVDKCGSLNMAAKNLRISYQHAWTMINEMNSSASEPLVVKQRGGNSGGGTELSAFGRKTISEYLSIEQQVKKTINQINVEINL